MEFHQNPYETAGSTQSEIVARKRPEKRPLIISLLTVYFSLGCLHFIFVLWTRPDLYVASYIEIIFFTLIMLPGTFLFFRGSLIGLWCSAYFLMLTMSQSIWFLSFTPVPDDVFSSEILWVVIKLIFLIFLGGKKPLAFFGVDKRRIWIGLLVMGLAVLGWGIIKNLLVYLAVVKFGLK
ncbi:MAG: hypothetical protein KDC71_11165 [Acidobacteria bacterium]|nr:hypothetical protein [Acidobacteriota bacterium]